MKELGQRAIENRLNAAFESFYGAYEDTAEWYPDTENNVWKCDIKEINKTVTFTCNTINGNVNIKEEDI